MSPTLNGEVLKNIAHKTNTATVVATAIALRQRMRNESDLTRTYIELSKAGEKIDQKEYLAFWKDLQAAGIGSIVYGRNGNHDRFIWNYSLKNVGKSMIEGGNFDAERLTTPPKKTPLVEKFNNKVMPAPPKKRGRPRKNPLPTVDKTFVVPQPTPTGKIIFVALRRDFNVEVNLPIDVSGREVGIITEALKKAL